MNETIGAYDVAVEEGGLNFEHAGPLFERYVVNLAGRLDRRWADCYNRMSTGSPSTARFKLEPGASTVSFTCRSSDGPAEVMGVLKRLEDLLVKVNKAASAEATTPAPAPARIGSRPPLKDAGERPAVGLAAGLFARFTRH